MEDGEGLVTNAIINSGKPKPVHGEPQETCPDDIPPPERETGVKIEVIFIGPERIEHYDKLV